MDKIEQRILAILDANADRIFAFGDDIWHHAELGYMEARTEPGYLPIVPVQDAGVVHEVFDLVDPEHRLIRGAIEGEKLAGTTDYGDLSSIIPVIQFNTAGASGAGHNANFRISDPKLYYLTTAKIFALMGYRLMKDGAALARKLIAENKPLYTREESLALRARLSKLETMEMSPVPDHFE